MKQIFKIIPALVLILLSSCTKEEKAQFTFGTVSDADGNKYKTITIGTQTWMAGNLKVSHYRNGETIANVTDSAAWSELTSGALCNYNNEAGNAQIYGSLYNWYAAADSRGLAPEGWHIPAKYEWETLISYLGGSTLAGAKMRLEGADYWWAYGTSSNESGFSAIGAGARTDIFKELKGYALWWTSTENTSIGGEYAYIDALNSGIVIINTGKKCGFSIRCVKD